MTIRGYRRADGGKGIRNHLLVVYLVECAHHVAREVAEPFLDQGVQVIGFPNCYPCAHAERMLGRLCTHPNVAGALLVSLGCEGFGKSSLAAVTAGSGRPVETLTIQRAGGTLRTIEAGRSWVREALAAMQETPRADLSPADLTVAVMAGDARAPAAPAVRGMLEAAGARLVSQGGRVILADALANAGPEAALADRAFSPRLRMEIGAAMEKAARYRAIQAELLEPAETPLGPAPAMRQTTSAIAISGLLKPGDVPPGTGLYLLDSVPDGEVRFGVFDLNENVAMGEAASCGAHLILYWTERGSAAGSAIAPVIKLCGDSDTFGRLREDLDIDAGRLGAGLSAAAELTSEIVDRVIRVAGGEPSAAEALGHREFTLTYKSFAPSGPACLPTI